eukprot:8956959-Pyramimonas_sp.AAC.1
MTPRMLLTREARAIARFWRVPPQSTAGSDYLAIGAWATGLRIRSMRAAGLAAMMRAAHAT